MSAYGPPAKRMCLPTGLGKALNVVKPAVPLPQDIINVIKNFCDKTDEETYRLSFGRFRKGDIDRATALHWLKQLEDNVLVLSELPNKEKISLIDGLVKSSWIWQCDDATVKQYGSLLECLLSFNASYATTVVESLVTLFYSTTKEENVVSLGKFNENETRLFNNLHPLLERIVVKLVPVTAVVLVETMKAKFPIEQCDRNMQACYVMHVLKVIDYLPNFRMQILEKLVFHFKILDLECPWDKIQEAEQTSICESIPEGDQSLDNIIYKMNHKQANLLDVLMKLTFEFIRKTCYNVDGTINGQETRKLFKELLTIFHKTMVGVKETSHVQFLMFYISSYHLRLCRGFFDYFWKQTIDANLPNVKRTWAACYIGSYIVRQVTIPTATVKDCLQLLKDWVHNYLEKYTAGQIERRDDHAPFYAVCQAIFYIITYRIEELMKMKNGPHFVSTLHLTSIISSPLRPLKRCSAKIAQQFVIKVQENLLGYCNPNMLDEANAEPLNFFLPFDPYILARSSEFIEPIYRVHIEQDFYGDQSTGKDDGLSEDDDEALAYFNQMSTKEGELIFKRLEIELQKSVEKDRLRKLQNDAKIRATQQQTATYEEFKNIVAAAHLKPMERNPFAKN